MILWPSFFNVFKDDNRLGNRFSPVKKDCNLLVIWIAVQQKFTLVGKVINAMEKEEKEEERRQKSI
ncbi:hypothetical protein C1H46_026774 [Malus baccata]|uniref:Uncharacterized protein n=1 Tax=Malus baccata TaxID=106549 RepID=A0A540LME1_MALBA|nr:hypothetical protein C1H46_026774 [Malus baccata]